MSLEDTDKEAAAVATAPRVALADIEAKIVARFDLTGADAIGTREPYMPELERVSICILVMRNGFTVGGLSAPAAYQNFDRQLGIRFAYENAIRQLWPLEGYALRERLAAERTP